MRKSRKKPARGKSAAPSQAAPAQPERRATLKLLRNAAIALPVLAGIGYFSARSVQATISEADLGKIGQGLPAIVQIHDPSCSVCRRLQKQTRQALADFAPGSHEFLVADINTAEGGALAAKHVVPNITLLLFDAQGQMVQVLRGPQEADFLQPIFANLIGGR